MILGHRNFLIMIFDFIKQKRAGRALNLALNVILLGRNDLIILLKKKYKKEWNGIVDDIVKGANSYATALLIIEIMIIDTLNNKINADQAKVIAESICNNSFENNRPAVFIIIAQAAYFSFLMERDGVAPKGIAGGFLNDIANWFSEKPEIRKKVFDYLLENTMRFREEAKESISPEFRTRPTP